MEKEKRDYRAHVLGFPYPCQGHINPMLQFCKRLAFKGLKATLVTTFFISKSMQMELDSIEVQTISDGYDEGGFVQAESIEAYLTRFKEVGSQTLTDLIKKQNCSGHPVNCLVYDPFMPWALDVAKQFGLLGAPFFTQSCAVNSIYNHVHQGVLKVPVSDSIISIPGLPPLEVMDRPSLISVSASYPAYTTMVLNQFSNVENADWILANSFNELESEVVEWMTKRLPTPLLTIGPAVPSMYLDKRVAGDKDYGLNLFKPDKGSCMNWLDKRAARSVVYVSFGSMAALSAEQIEEIAWGLRRSNTYFLWVLRSDQDDKLPGEFLMETAEKGLIVRWCSQLEVLAREAIGCFITHCGWNSTLEALSTGVAMVGMPQWTDQTTNAKLVMDVWRIGVRARPDDKGIVSREEVERCIVEVMEGERGKQIKKNAIKWKNLAREAVDEGGSSDKNIDGFIAKLVSLKCDCLRK